MDWTHFIGGGGKCKMLLRVVWKVECLVERNVLEIIIIWNDKGGKGRIVHRYEEKSGEQSGLERFGAKNPPIGRTLDDDEISRPIRINIQFSIQFNLFIFKIIYIISAV